MEALEALADKVRQGGSQEEVESAVVSYGECAEKAPEHSAPKEMPG